MKKTLLYAIASCALIFSACSDDDDNNGGNNGLGKDGELIVKATEITGIPSTIDIAKVDLVVWNWDKDELETVATAKWDNGFSINFPETLASKYLRPFFEDEEDDDDDDDDDDDFVNTITISDRNVKISDTDTELRAFDAEGEYLGTIFIGKTDLSTVGIYVYADGDCKITGKYGDSVEMEIYDMDLKKGWNIVYEIETKTADSFESKSTTTSPSGLGWVFSEEYYF